MVKKFPLTDKPTPKIERGEYDELARNLSQWEVEGRVGGPNLQYQPWEAHFMAIPGMGTAPRSGGPIGLERVGTHSRRIRRDLGSPPTPS